MRHIHFLVSFIVSSIIFTSQAFAGSMTLTPNTTTIQTRSDGSAVVAYTLLNTISQPLSDITIDPGYGGGNSNHLFLQNNTCPSTLSGYASCSFQILIQGINQSSSFELSPRACAFNGITCIVAADGFRPQVTVVPVTHPVTAYFALTSGTHENYIQPVQIATQSLGTPIPGFDFTTVISAMSPETSIVYRGIGTMLSPDGNTLYVPNPGNNNVSIVDVTTTPAQVSNVLLTIPPPFVSAFPPIVEPTSVVVTPNNQTLFVSTLGTQDIYVIDVPTRSVIHIIPTAGFMRQNGCRLDTPESSPTNMTITNTVSAISPDGTTVYTSINSDILIINTSNYQLSTFYCSPIDDPRGMVVSPDNSTLYVTNYVSNTVAVLNTVTQEFGTVIAVGNAPVGIAISPNGATLYVANSASQTLSVIDTASRTVSRTVALPGSIPEGVSITPDGTQLYVGYQNSTSASVINTTTFEITEINVTGNQVSLVNFVG